MDSVTPISPPPSPGLSSTSSTTPAHPPTSTCAIGHTSLAPPLTHPDREPHPHCRRRFLCLLLVRGSREPLACDNRMTLFLLQGLFIFYGSTGNENVKTRIEVCNILLRLGRKKLVGRRYCAQNASYIIGGLRHVPEAVLS